MKRLKSSDPERQRRWEHNGRSYSIVDLTLFPMEADGTRYKSPSNTMDFYKPTQFEVAEFTKDDGIDVLGRFTSFEEAEAAIESGAIHDGDDQI